MTDPVTGRSRRAIAEREIREGLFVRQSDLEPASGRSVIFYWLTFAAGFVFGWLSHL